MFSSLPVSHSGWESCRLYVCIHQVTLLDPDSLKPVHKLKAHSGTLSDFDVHGNQLITCGFANRQVKPKMANQLNLNVFRVAGFNK